MSGRSSSQPGLAEKRPHNIRTGGQHELHTHDGRSGSARIHYQDRIQLLLLARYCFTNAGVMFMTLTSTSNYDTLILQRSATQSSGVYTTTVSDYYVSSGRQGTLMSDTLTSFDLTTSSSSTSSEFVLTYPRTKSNTNG